MEKNKRVTGRFNIRVNYREKDIINALAKDMNMSQSNTVLTCMRKVYAEYCSERKEKIKVRNWDATMWEGAKGGPRTSQIEIRTTDHDRAFLDSFKKAFGTPTIASYALYCVMCEYIKRKDHLNVEA